MVKDNRDNKKPAAVTSSATFVLAAKDLLHAPSIDVKLYITVNTALVKITDQWFHQVGLIPQPKSVITLNRFCSSGQFSSISF